MKMEVKKFFVCRQWHDSKLQDVLEYFHTLNEAIEYSRRIKRSTNYTVMIGEF